MIKISSFPILWVMSIYAGKNRTSATIEISIMALFVLSNVIPDLNMYRYRLPRGSLFFVEKGRGEVIDGRKMMM